MGLGNALANQWTLSSQLVFNSADQPRATMIPFMVVMLRFWGFCKGMSRGRDFGTTSGVIIGTTPPKFVCEGPRGDSFYL